MPKISYTDFFENLLNHKNINVELGVDALKDIRIDNNFIYFKNEKINFPVVYTGPIDELFNHKYGVLPYRSLRFDFCHENIDSKQDMPVVAYPQDPQIIRIIEYKKLPHQNISGTTYEKEYSLPYSFDGNQEPYYPVLTKESMDIYESYRKELDSINNLYIIYVVGLVILNIIIWIKRLNLH